MPLDLTISIINHSNPEMLRDCLRSIDATTHKIQFEIMIVDNATGGRLVDEIRQEFPHVKWLFNRQRRGFSANHNQVMATSQARYICILNDDTILHDGTLDHLVAYLDAHPKAGMVGPRTFNPDGSIQNSAFHDKSLLGECIDILILPGLAERLKRRGIDARQFAEQPANVDWILGACIAVRRETLDQIGMLDDKLSPIANCEEVDWCRRARMAGWNVAFVPESKIVHFGGQSMKTNRGRADFFRVEMHRAILAYFQKHLGMTRTLLLRLFYIASLPWNGLMLAQSVLRGRTAKAQASAHWATLLQIAGVAIRPNRPNSVAANVPEPAHA